MFKKLSVNTLKTIDELTMSSVDEKINIFEAKTESEKVDGVKVTEDADAAMDFTSAATVANTVAEKELLPLLNINFSDLRWRCNSSVVTCS